MTISVILRLTLPALREGRIAGQVELVDDGTRVTVRDATELVEAIRTHVGEAATPTSEASPDSPPTCPTRATAPPTGG